MEKKRRNTPVWPTLEIAEALKNALSYRGKEQEKELRRLARAIRHECQRQDEAFERGHGKE